MRENISNLDFICATCTLMSDPLIKTNWRWEKIPFDMSHTSRQFLLDMVREEMSLHVIMPPLLLALVTKLATRWRHLH